MKDLLVSWGVETDKELFQLVEESLLFGKCHSRIAVGNESVGLLSFKPHVTLKDICSLHDKVSAWFCPILQNKDLLSYFSAHGSVLFRAYMEEQLERVLQNAQSLQSGVASYNWASSIFGHDFDIAEADDGDQSRSRTVSLQTFSECIQRARRCLIQLLDQTAKFQDVSVIGQERVKGVDVDRELATLVEYPEFRNSCELKSVQSGISDMLGLVQYTSIVQVYYVDTLL